jgi:hypothetical protein
VDATNDGVPCKWAGCECPRCASEMQWAKHVHVHLEKVKEIFSTTTLASTHRGAQTAVFELDIRIFNLPYIDVCQSLASETGLKSINVEKRINAV